MKTVGTLSFHCQYNFGSALQAYALQEAIKKLGFKCLILNFYYEEDMKNYDIRWSSKRLSIIILDLLTFYLCYQRKRAYKKFHSLFLNFSVQTKEWERLGEISKDCDYLICGSDQIWNPAINNSPAYFLPFAKTHQKKISYAPSIALPTIPQNKVEWFRKNIQDFSYISIREKNCVNQLQEISGREIECVLDPTMLLEIEDYEQLLGSYKIVLPENYVFLYCIHLQDLERLSILAKKLAEKENLKIVYFNKFSLNYKERFAKNIFKYDPRAFLYSIKNAKYVISNSFHACVFSILYKKQFFMVQVDGSQSRLTTLFDTLGIDGRCLSSDNIENAIPIDYNEVLKKLSEKKVESWRYLKKALDYGTEIGDINQ